MGSLGTRLLTVFLAGLLAGTVVPGEASAQEPPIPSLLPFKQKKPKKKPKKRLKLVVAEEEEEEEPVDPASKKRTKTKGRRLEYDEDLGQVVVKRQRKKSRARDEWEDYLD